MKHISKANKFALIEAIGNETVEAIAFSNNKKVATSFREISNEELTQRVMNKESVNIVLWDKKPRLSIAGVQDKLPLIVFKKHIIDGCQVLDLDIAMKYEAVYGDFRGKANFKNLFETSSLTRNKILTKLKLLKWFLFSLCINNFDAYAKNIKQIKDEMTTFCTPKEIEFLEALEKNILDTCVKYENIFERIVEDYKEYKNEYL